MFKYIVFLFIINQLNAVENKEYFQLSEVNNLKNTTKLKTYPCKEDSYITNPSKTRTIEKVIQINNFYDLINELKLEDNISAFKNKNIAKLLNDKNINKYTLTYLIHVSVTKYKENLKKHIKDCNLTHTNSSKIGGEFIALVHIKTKSKNDYKKVQKIKIDWKNIDKLKEISNSHIVTFKNILNADDTFIPANDLKTLISNAKQFSKNIIHHEIQFKNKTSKDTNKTKIDIYLKAFQTINNLEYIRRNPNQFSKENNETTPTIMGNKIKILLKHQDIEEVNNLINKVAYPKRFNAFNENHITEIQKINLPSKKIKNKYPKIIEESNISIKYNFKLELQNNGKVVLLKWFKQVRVKNKLIHQEKNSKILFDSYINFKNLKASQLKGNNIGSLNYITKFDAYEKHKTIQGFGIIESAICSYEIKDKNGTFEFDCKDIKLKDLDIKFEHVE